MYEEMLERQITRDVRDENLRKGCSQVIRVPKKLRVALGHTISSCKFVSEFEEFVRVADYEYGGCQVRSDVGRHTVSVY